MKNEQNKGSGQV